MYLESFLLLYLRLERHLSLALTIRTIILIRLWLSSLLIIKVIQNYRTIIVKICVLAK